ncbi:DUF4189 domain-containing protein [Stenotrophomonas sp.]|uniref:DUF4189 domain-containing protein n=1 Tax=Stenotrophomonas sp. TaxID=69392 RepID=UPI00289A6787|nr:DUF4189 domain-containing protein [Stenotrophomonas sp.]
MNIATRVFLLLGIALSIDSASAQQPQPGSVEYNTVYLPAHGVGDTRRPNPGNRWGAVATGRGAVIGFMVGARSESEAKRAAIGDCVAAGGRECLAEEAFVNSCAVVTMNSSQFSWSIADPKKRSAEWLRTRALSKCGTEDCKIIREGCASPVR